MLGAITSTLRPCSLKSRLTLQASVIWRFKQVLFDTCSRILYFSLPYLGFFGCGPYSLILPILGHFKGFLGNSAFSNTIQIHFGVLHRSFNIQLVWCDHREVSSCGQTKKRE